MPKKIKELKEKYDYIKSTSKTYCVDCVYYQEFKYIQAGGTSQSFTVPEECLADIKDKTKYVDTYKCSMPITKLPCEINFDNDCIYFKRKL